MEPSPVDRDPLIGWAARASMVVAIFDVPTGAKLPRAPVEPAPGRRSRESSMATPASRAAAAPSRRSSGARGRL